MPLETLLPFWQAAAEMSVIEDQSLQRGVNESSAWKTEKTHSHSRLPSKAAAVLLLTALLSGAGWAAEPAGPTTNALLRAEFLQGARPALRQLLADTEERSGLRMTFTALPEKDWVVARCTYDPFRNEALIQLRRGWQDVDVAHELMHLRMELLEGFSLLAWRRDVLHTEAREAAFGRVQTYVNDEVVHWHLVQAGLKLDGEVLRPPLFDDIYANVARYLEEDRTRANDGMAHLDKLGHGALCRAAFLVQAELILKNYRAQLPPERIQKAERFVRAFRAHRPEETTKAAAVLALFREHDVQKPAGQREILRRWAALEGVDQFVGVSTYQKTARGNYILPFPTRD